MSQEDDEPRRELLNLRREIRALRRVHSVIHFLASAQDDEPALYSRILGLAAYVSKLRRGMLVLKDPGAETQHACRVRVAIGFDEDAYHSKDGRDLRRIAEGAFESGEAIFQTLKSPPNRRVVRQPRISRLGAVVCLPLRERRGGNLHGVLLLNDLRRERAFTGAEESVLHSFARHTALALVRLAESQEEISYTQARELFLRRYLSTTLRRARGDLRAASKVTGLSIERLMAYMSHLGLDLEQALAV